MRRLVFLAAAATAVLALPAAALAAQPGFTTTSLSLRAGPGLDYPAVDRLPAGARVRIDGCLAGYNWCDVVWRGEYGWVRGDDLAFLYRGRRVVVLDYGPVIGLPIVTFAIGPYWREHYRDRPFFARIDEFQHGGHGFRHERYGEYRNGRAYRRDVTVGQGPNGASEPRFVREHGVRAAHQGRAMHAVAPHAAHPSRLHGPRPAAPQGVHAAAPAQVHMGNPARAQAIGAIHAPRGPAGGHGPAMRGPGGGHAPGGPHGPAHGPKHP